MDCIGNETGTHPPMKIANGTPAGAEVADALEQGAPDQKLRN